MSCTFDPRHGWSRGGPPPWWPAGTEWRGWTPPPWDRWRRRRRYAPFAVWAVLTASWAAWLVVAVIGWIARWWLGDGGPSRVPIPIALVLAIFVFVLGVMVLLTRFASPLSALVSASDRVASGDLRVRLPERGAPWLRHVAYAFNSMTSRLERQDQQRRELMADVAHELRTPLAAMQGRLEGMLDGVYPQDPAQVAQVLDDTRLLARLVEDLRTLAHSESGALRLQREPMDLGGLVRETMASLRPAADARGVAIDVHDPGTLPAIEVDPIRIREVLFNLASNAIRHAPAGSRVDVDVASVDGMACIRVRDRGPGVAPEDLPRLFDRFYKGSGSDGSGLGLTIARNLVAAHGGRIRAEHGDGGGLVVTVDLPIRE